MSASQEREALKSALLDLIGAVEFMIAQDAKRNPSGEGLPASQVAMARESVKQARELLRAQSKEQENGRG